MNIGIIGRSEYTFNSMIKAKEKGHKIAFIVTSKESPEFKYSSDDFKAYAAENEIPFLYEPKLSLQTLNSLGGIKEADICISVNYSGVIPQSVIERFPLGILNAHGGDLPRYRGNACQAWALINGEDQIGLCIHNMIGGELDSGPIIERSYFPIDINTRIQQVYDWMDEEIPILMVKALNNLENDSNCILEKQSKDPRDALRCYPRKPEDGRIDWTKDAEDIVRLINASSEPYSGAFSYLEDEKVIIWRAEVVADHESWCGIPGQVASLSSEGFAEILCGNGKVRVKVIEIDGSRVAPAEKIKSLRSRLS